MSKSPMVSVVVPCRNESEHIESVLRSILSQEPPPGGLEVIVADGMSEDGTREILARLVGEDDRLQVVDNPRQIVASGLNAAIKLARGSVIIRMDAHTEYAKDYIRRCLEVLRSTGADNVGGPWIAKGRGRVGQAIAAAFHSPFSFGGARGHNCAYEGIVDTVYLGCCPREIFERIGFFDEELVRNQDDEFNLRLTRAGGKIWQSPTIRSWYTPRASLDGLFKQYMQYGFWKVRVLQKHRIPASFRHLVPGTFVATLASLVLLSFWLSAALSCAIGLFSIYVVFNLSVSVFTAMRCGWNLLPILPVAFGSFHWGYGLGFLHGVWDFVILRRKSNGRYEKLTRVSVQPTGAPPINPTTPIDLSK